jgi:hypothetical protein
MRVALFLIAIAITDLAPNVNEAKKEAVPILVVIFCFFVVMDIVDFFKN